MATTDVREVATTERSREVYPLFSQLRDHLSLDEFLDQLATMREDGYRLFVLSDDDEDVAVAGVSVEHNFHLGRHLFVYDLVTDEDRRGEGYGGELLEYVHDLAAAEDCECVALESGLWRDRAHEFYEAHGYEKRCYSFERAID